MKKILLATMLILSSLQADGSFEYKCKSGHKAKIDNPIKVPVINNSEMWVHITDYRLNKRFKDREFVTVKEVWESRDTFYDDRKNCKILNNGHKLVCQGKAPRNGAKIMDFSTKTFFSDVESFNQPYIKDNVKIYVDDELAYEHVYYSLYNMQNACEDINEWNKIRLMNR